MKRFCIFLTLYTLLSVVPAWAQVVSFPYTQGFENGLNGWTDTSMNSENEGLMGIRDVAAKTGFYGYSFSSYSFASNYTQYLISPEIQCNADAFFMKFSYRGSDSYSENFHIGYSTTTNDLTAFTWSEQYSSTMDWADVSYSIPANATYVAIKYTSECVYNLYIDDIKLYEANIPEISMDDRYSTTTNVPLVISAAVTGQNPITYTWSSTMESRGDATSSPIDTSFIIDYTVGGIDTVTLIASNSYGSDTAVAVVMVCGAIPYLPLEDDFESYTPNDRAYLNPCWGAGSFYANPYVTTIEGNNKVLYFYSGPYPDYTYYITPPFDTMIAMNTLEITFDLVHFYASATSACDMIVAAIDTNVYVIGTTPIDTLAFFRGVSGQPEQMLVNLSRYTGTKRRILFLGQSQGRNYNYVYMDNLSIHAIPECGRPQSIAVSNISPDSVSVFINDPAEANNYYVVLLQGGDTVQTTVVTDTSFILTDLDASTYYTLTVATLCSTGDTSTVAVRNFRTMCGVAPFPWHENFDVWGSRSDCWQFLRGAYNMGHGISTATSVDFGWLLYSGSYGDHITLSGKALAMKIYGNNGYWAITPNIAIESNNAMLYVDVAMAAWTSPITDYDANDTVAFAISVDSGATFTNLAVYNYTQLNSIGNAYSTFEIPVTGYNGQTVRFAIFGGSSRIGGDNRFVIDNLRVGEATACVRPLGVVASNLTTTSATLTINDPAAASNYHVVLLQGNDTVQDLVSNDTIIALTELTHTTVYTVSVATICADDTFTDEAHTTFMTACPPVDVLPIEDDFESYNTGSSYYLDGCWGYGTNNIDSAYPQVVSVYDDKVLYFSSHGSSAYNYYISPVIDETILLNTLEITFKMKQAYSSSSYTSNMLVAAIDSNVYVAGVTPIDTLALFHGNAIQWEEKIVNLSTYTGTKHRILFLAQASGFNNNYVYMDSLSIHLLPSCARPVNISVDNMTATSATISWMGTANSFEYKLIDGNDSLVATGTVSETSVTLDGLTLDADYTFILRSLCSGNSTDWCAISFHLGYCQPTPESINGSGIINVTFGHGNEVVNNSNSPTSAPLYGNYSNLIGAVSAGGVETIIITYGTRYTYGTFIWVDWNKNFVFEGSEVVHFSNSPSGNIVVYAATITIPSTVDTGYYRMRIAGADNYYDSYTTAEDAANADPCPQGTSYTIVHDYTLHVNTISQQPQPTLYTVSANSASDFFGCASVSPCGTVVEGTSVTFTASAIDGYRFVAWMNGTTQVSTANPYITTVSSNLSLTATFEAVSVAPDCLAPTNVSASNVTATSATIAWTANGTETQWEIDYGGTTVTTGTNPATLTGLTANTEYSVRVRALCGDGASSDWSEATTFTTPAPQGIEEVNGAAISLYPNPATTSVTIEGIEGSATVTLVDMNGRTVRTAVAESTTTLDLTGLAQGAYFVRITGEQQTAIRKLIVK